MVAEDFLQRVMASAEPDCSRREPRWWVVTPGRRFDRGWRWCGRLFLFSTSIPRIAAEASWVWASPGIVCVEFTSSKRKRDPIIEGCSTSRYIPSPATLSQPVRARYPNDRTSFSPIDDVSRISRSSRRTRTCRKTSPTVQLSSLYRDRVA